MCYQKNRGGDDWYTNFIEVFLEIVRTENYLIIPHEVVKLDHGISSWFA